LAIRQDVLSVLCSRSSKAHKKNRAQMFERGFFFVVVAIKKRGLGKDRASCREGADLTDHCAFCDGVDVATDQADVFQFRIGQARECSMCQALVVPGHNRRKEAADE
jgi:hypothetical protein